MYAYIPWIIVSWVHGSRRLTSSRVHAPPVPVDLNGAHVQRTEFVIYRDDAAGTRARLQRLDCGDEACPFARCEVLCVLAYAGAQSAWTGGGSHISNVVLGEGEGKDGRPVNEMSKKSSDITRSTH